jgi:hypothetical protein
VSITAWPWHTTVFAQWDGAATLLDGDASYVNRGLHVFTLLLPPKRQLASTKLSPNKL